MHTITFVKSIYIHTMYSKVLFYMINPPIFSIRLCSSKCAGCHKAFVRAVCWFWTRQRQLV